MRRAALALILILLAPGLTGCVGSGDDPVEPSSGPANSTMADRANVAGIPAELDEIRAVDVEAGDGAHLRGHVYLPEGDGPFAPILVFTPYVNLPGIGRSSDGYATEEDGRRTMAGMYGPLLDAGFAVALVNVRGTGASDGCVRYGGPRAVEDAGTVVEALAQAPWSNGRVGMYGISYYAKTQYMAIASGAPALEAVVPMSSVLDHWQLVTRNGAWTGYEPMSRYVGLYSGPSALGPTSPGPTVQPDRAECPDYLEDLQGTAGTAASGDKNAWFQARDYRQEISRATVPMFVTNGLGEREGHVLQVRGLWDLMPDQRRLLLGQWHHDTPHDHVEDWDGQVVAWFDHHLREGPERVDTGVVRYQDDTGGWHQDDAWPPRGNETTLHLSDGALVAEPGAVEPGEQTFQAHPDRPLPDTCPGTKALYVSPPLADDVVLAGNVSVELTVTSTRPDGNFATVLWHVEAPWPCPEPRATYDEAQDDGVGDHEIATAISDLAHRGHRTQGEPFPVGEPGEMRMTSEPFASRVPAGDRLVLTVAGGDSWIRPQPPFPQLTVETGPELAGELVLNVVDGDVDFEGPRGDRSSPSIPRGTS